MINKIPEKILWLLRFSIAISLVAICTLMINGSQIVLNVTWIAISFIPIALMIFGHTNWRRICPLAFISMLPFRKGRAVSQSSWLARYPFLPFIILLSAVAARIAFIGTNPEFFGMFFSLLLLTILLVGFLYQGRSWCHYFCPVGVAQQFYIGPRGLLDLKPHEENSEITGSMCRTSGKNLKDPPKLACLNCKKNCPDIDIENAYWNDIDTAKRLVVMFGYPALLFGFFFHDANFLQFFDYEQNTKSHFIHSLSQLALCSTISIAVGFSLRLTPRLKHIVYTLIAFVTIITYYTVISQSWDWMPEIAGKLLYLTIIIASTLWLLKALQRTPKAHQQELTMSSLLMKIKQLPYDIYSVFDSYEINKLKPSEVNLLANLTPKVIQKVRAAFYSEAEKIRHGKNNQLSDQLLITDEEALLALDEKDIVIQNYKKIVSIAQSEMRFSEKNIISLLKTPEFIDEIEELEFLMGMNEWSQEKVQSDVDNKLNYYQKNLIRSISNMRYLKYLLDLMRINSDRNIRCSAFLYKQVLLNIKSNIYDALNYISNVGLIEQTQEFATCIAACLQDDEINLSDNTAINKLPVQTSSMLLNASNLPQNKCFSQTVSNKELFDACYEYFLNSKEILACLIVYRWQIEPKSIADFRPPNCNSLLFYELEENSKKFQDTSGWSKLETFLSLKFSSVFSNLLDATIENITRNSQIRIFKQNETLNIDNKTFVILLSGSCVENLSDVNASARLLNIDLLEQSNETQKVTFYSEKNVALLIKKEQFIKLTGAEFHLPWVSVISNIIHQIRKDPDQVIKVGLKLDIIFLDSKDKASSNNEVENKNQAELTLITNRYLAIKFLKPLNLKKLPCLINAITISDSDSDSRRYSFNTIIVKADDENSNNTYLIYKPNVVSRYNRRNSIRVNTEIRATVDTNILQPCIINDISAGGIRISSFEKKITGVKIGKDIDIIFKLPNYKIPIRLTCIVHNMNTVCLKNNIEDYQYGLNIININSDAKIKLQRYIFEQYQSQSQKGGFIGWQYFKVSKIVAENDDIKSFYFSSLNNSTLPEYKPGQFLTIKLLVPINGEVQTVVRCYSLSRASQSNEYRISVKKLLGFTKPDDPTIKTPDGVASTYLHNVLKEGDIVSLRAPAGEFVLDEIDSRGVVLIGGGIGITPMIAMLETLLNNGSSREIYLFYGAIEEKGLILTDYFLSLQEKHSNFHFLRCLSNPNENDKFDKRGHIDADYIKSVLPHLDFGFYLCGPPPMMKAVYSGLKSIKVPEEDINYEAFGPASISENKEEETKAELPSHVNITFSGSDVTINVEVGNKTILELAEERGFKIPSGCRVGNCLTCKCIINKGTVIYKKKPMSLCTDQVLLCTSKPASDIELDI